MEIPSDNVVGMPQKTQAAQSLPEVYLAMAAAQMHSEGRLIKPQDDGEDKKRGRTGKR